MLAAALLSGSSGGNLHTSHFSSALSSSKASSDWLVLLALHPDSQSSACSSTEDDPSGQSRTLFPSKGSELAAFILFVALIPLCCEIAHLQILDADIF